MNCQVHDEDRLLLYSYGDLPAEDEEQLEQHLESCSDCRAGLERLRAFGRAFDSRSLEPQPPFLAECRQGLLEAVENASEPPLRWSRVRALFPGFASPALGLRRLGFAAALVALGFFGARVPLRTTLGDIGRKGWIGRVGGGPESIQTSGFVPETFSNIRSVQPDPASGRVRIVLDETNRHAISGTLEEPAIRKLLFAAAADGTNPGLRVESVSLLKDCKASEEVRTALLGALERDPNPGVRLKALEGLKGFAQDAEVRRALARVLATDKNPGVRVQVIEVLTRNPDDSLVGVFQNLVRHEDNNYVRLRVQEALRHMNASEGTF